MMLYRHDHDSGNRLAAAVISDKLKCHHLPAFLFSVFRSPVRNFTVRMNKRAVTILPRPQRYGCRIVVRRGKPTLQNKERKCRKTLLT